FGHGWKFGPRIGLIAIDEDQPTVAWERREQAEPRWPDDDAAALGRTRKTDFCVRDDESPVICLAAKMLLHGIARDAVSAAGTQHIGRCKTFSSAGAFKRYAQAARTIFDRFYLCAVLDDDAEAVQMIAQNGFCLPLRQAALKFMFTSHA